jgi:hypothetical protein
LHVWGPLRIVPSCDLGVLGPAAGEPAFYVWHWYYSAPITALWAMLLLAIAVPTANHRRGVLLILVPALLAYASGSVLASTFGGTASEKEVYRAMARSVAVGLAVLWLMSPVFAIMSWRRALVLALGIALAVALAGALSFFDFSGPTIVYGSLLFVALPTVVVGHVLAGRTSRHGYEPVRLVLVLATCIVILITTGCLVAFGIWFGATTHEGLSRIGRALRQTTAMGLLLGSYVFLVSLAFMLVGLCSPLFRPRLFACLRLPLPRLRSAGRHGGGRHPR